MQPECLANGIANYTNHPYFDFPKEFVVSKLQFMINCCAGRMRDMREKHFERADANFVHRLAEAMRGITKEIDRTAADGVLDATPEVG
jgi:hypothetical protein